MNNKETKIGYGNPPKETQFKKGESGNKQGRPKGSKNTHTLLQQILNQKITIKENGKTIRISKKQAMLTHAINKGIKGDLKAISLLFPHILIAEFKEEEKRKVLSTLKTDDEEVLKIFAETLNKEKAIEVNNNDQEE